MKKHEAVCKKVRYQNKNLLLIVPVVICFAAQYFHFILTITLNNFSSINFLHGVDIWYKDIITTVLLYMSSLLI